MNYQAAVSVLPAPQAASQLVASNIISLSKKFIGHNHQFNLALAGGSTPHLLYQTLASDTYKDFINWNKTHLFLSDERFSPTDLSKSNQFHITKYLTNHINIPPQNLHFPIIQNTSLNQSRIQYQRDLVRHFGNSTPSFDLVILGIGTDGHTASIFPASEDTITPTDKLILSLSNSSLTLPQRLTFSYKLINNASTIFILATGKSKKEILKKVFSTQPNPQTYPIQGVQTKSGQLSWFVDAAAHSSA